MNKNTITYKGTILFDPKDMTNKHSHQSSWKKVALVMFDGDMSEYYSWFIKKRYNLKLNKPLRGSHISFINDSVRDIKSGMGLVNEKDVHFFWDKLAEKWNGKEIDVTLDVDMRGDGEYWWLNIPEEERTLLHSIRTNIGIGRPHWGLHMSIGYANSKNIEHSKYILRCIKKGLI